MAKKVAFDMEVLKKHLFWICTPIGLVVAVLAGIMAIGSIAEDLDKQKKQLDGQKETMGRLRGEAANHPNQGTIDAVEEERKKLVENVFTAWQVLVNDQMDQNRWPKLAGRATQELERKNFLDNTLDGGTLANYLAFAKAEINKLVDNSGIKRVKLYDAQWQPLEPDELVDTSGSGGGYGGARTPMGNTRGGSSSSSGTPTLTPIRGPVYLGGLVVWEQPALDITMKNWGDRPYPFEVWLTQEDIWVYQALLWVVAKSNQNAVADRVRINIASNTTGRMSADMASAGTNTRPLNLENSVVKQIVDIAIGQQAAMQLYTQSSRRISSGMGGMGMDGGMGMGMGMGSSSGFGGGGFGGGGFGGGGFSDAGGFGMGGMDSAAAAEALRTQALGGRYVDASGAPLMEAEEALAGQFRRMPVYLNFLADQRYISDILVSCANCPMPIDVKWVTINPDATQDFSFAASTSTGMGGSSGFGSGSGMMSSSMSSGSRPRSTGMGARPPGGGSSMSRGTGTSNVNFGSHAVQIEIYGCINIFSPPDRKKFTEETN